MLAIYQIEIRPRAQIERGGLNDLVVFLTAYCLALRTYQIICQRHIDHYK